MSVLKEGAEEGIRYLWLFARVSLYKTDKATQDPCHLLLALSSNTHYHVRRSLEALMKLSNGRCQRCATRSCLLWTIENRQSDGWSELFSASPGLKYDIRLREEIQDNHYFH